jgi:hypothetical protein
MFNLGMLKIVSFRCKKSGMAYFFSMKMPYAKHTGTLMQLQMLCIVYDIKS